MIILRRFWKELLSLIKILSMVKVCAVTVMRLELG